MSMTATYHVKDAYLLVQVSGYWTAAPAKALIQEILLYAQRVHRAHVFLDLLDLMPPKDNYDRYLTGVDVAEIWGGKLKVVALAKPEYISGFVENVAVNRGAKFAVFSNMIQAETWLGEINDR